jgi:hypothetical protein
MGFIRKVGDKRYLIKFNVRPTNGKARQQKTETLKGCTKKQAEAILAERKAQVDSGTYIQEQITVAMLFDMFRRLKEPGTGRQRRLRATGPCIRHTSNRPSGLFCSRTWTSNI